MLQTMRDNSQGIVAKILVGLIVVVFALWGVDSLVGLATAEPPPAEVNGVDVSRQDLFRGVELQRRQILTQMGSDADPELLDEARLRSVVLNGLIDRTLSMESADSAGLFVSEQMLDQLIVSTPEFQLDGRFDRDQFEAALRSAGYTPLSYRKLLREETLIAQERQAFAASAFLTSSELDRLLELNRQTRSVRYVEITPDLEAVQISESELQEEYDRVADQLLTPERVIVDYVVLEQEQFSDPSAVSQAEINGAYDLLVADFDAQEERLTRHILFEVTEEQDLDASLALAERVKDELNNGGDFAALAAQYSQDIGSAESGGDLGYLSPGLFEGSFDDTVFSLEEGAISDPVETDFGVHIIQVQDIRATEPPLLVEVEEDIRERIANDSAEEDYVEALERLADLSFSTGDLVAVSEELGLEIQESEPFSREGGEGVFGNSRLVNAAFSQTVLNENLNSDPIEVDPGKTLVIHLKERIPERVQGLDEVREQLVSQMKRERAEQAASDQAEKLLEQAQTDPTAISWSFAEDLLRGDPSDLDPQVVDRAFAMPRPMGDERFYSHVQLFDGRSIVLSVDSVGSVDQELPAEQRAQVAQQLSARRGEMSYIEQFQAYKEAAEIVVN